MKSGKPQKQAIAIAMSAAKMEKKHEKMESPKKKAIEKKKGKS